MAGKVVVDKTDLETLLNYCAEDEEKDWESYGEKEEDRPKNHIYCTIQRLEKTEPQYAIIAFTHEGHELSRTIAFVGSAEEVKNYLTTQMDLGELDVILPLDGSWDGLEFPDHYAEFGLEWDSEWILLTDKGVHNG